MCAAARIGRREGRARERSDEKAATLSPSLPLGQLCPYVRPVAVAAVVALCKIDEDTAAASSAAATAE